MDHIFAFSHVQTRYLALGPRFEQLLVAQVEGFASRRSFRADFAIFEILGGAGDINNSISMANYWDGPYRDLGICVSKVSRAWTEVWSGTNRARASVMAPGGRSGQFLSFWAGWWYRMLSILTMWAQILTQNHICTLVYTQTRFLGLGTWFWLVPVA